MADIWRNIFGARKRMRGAASTPTPSRMAICVDADILIWKGKYYLYYQTFLATSGTRGDDCPVSVSFSDSPDGPWTQAHKLVVPNGPEGAWDQYSIHDPYPLVYKGRIYLYYKSDMNPRPEPVRLTGLAMSDDPLAPFEKCPLNLVINSGHETCLPRSRRGLPPWRLDTATNTIQFATDGVNFDIASSVSLMPHAPGPYVPDAFTDTEDGLGITWGLCHFTGVGARNGRHSILARFDCCLSQDVHDFRFSETEHFWPSEFYFHSGLKGAREDRVETAARDLNRA